MHKTLIQHDEFVGRRVNVKKYNIANGKILLESKNMFYIVVDTRILHIPKKNNIFIIYIGTTPSIVDGNKIMHRSEERIPKCRK